MNSFRHLEHVNFDPSENLRASHMYSDEYIAINVLLLSFWSNCFIESTKCRCIRHVLDLIATYIAENEVIRATRRTENKISLHNFYVFVWVKKKKKSETKRAYQVRDNVY